MRAQILFVAYAIFESYSAKLQMSALNAFFADETHLLILLITFTLGFSTGVADVNSRNYLAVLRQTAGQLKIYSEWLLGRNLLGRAINDPNSMSLARRQRTVLFMDIRGFTRWSEQHSPEEVAMLLNGYYLTIENVMEKAEFIKYKFTADEVMGVFIDADKAVQAARELNAQIATYLQPYQLGAGIGINTGFLVEGLLGGKNIRFYDVIGDTVNTAHRIEGAANAGEIWISADARAQLADLSIQNEKEIALKGKELPAKVYLIQ
jgi:class 3 adenylate cyclase